MAREFKARITYDKDGKAKVVIPLPVINALGRPNSIEIVLENNQLTYIAREQTTKHDLNRGSRRDIAPLLSELGKIEHELYRDKIKEPCFTKRDVQKLLESNGIYLHLKSVERGLNALIAKGLLAKFFESEGLATLYRVTK